MRASPRDILFIALATLGFSLMGLTAKLITLPPMSIVLGRGLFAFAGLLPFVLFSRADRKEIIAPRDFPLVLLAGVFLSGNWIFYIIAIKVSSLSVAVLALFTYPLMTAFIEPLLSREKFNLSAAAAGVAVVVGVFLIVPELSWGNHITRGVFFGVLGGLSFVLRSISCGRLVRRYRPGKLVLIQFAVATLVVLPFACAENPSTENIQYIHFFFLGAVFTTVPLVLFTACLKRLSSTIAHLFLSVQPVVTLVLAAVFLGERPGIRVVLGAAIIVGAVAWVTTRPRPHEAQ